MTVSAGTTPAGAGTTYRLRAVRDGRRDHPRGRGDDIGEQVNGIIFAGPPPRARGRPTSWTKAAASSGTTPAGAGTTPPPSSTGLGARDHPRGRGDDRSGSCTPAPCRGPPPRARGRLATAANASAFPRTTPAGAGTTPCPPRTPATSRDHPRGRGDDGTSRPGPVVCRGPPPRARGRLAGLPTEGEELGTTPAGAGTTGPSPWWASLRRDHPRGRGDDSRSVFPDVDSPGPPPRARGRRAGEAERAGGLGTTPAGAGTTCGRSPTAASPGDHPRGRGDDPGRKIDRECRQGPPPRARGRPATYAATSAQPRTTPAGAGTTDRGRIRVEAFTGPPPRARGRRRQGPQDRPGHGTTPAGAGTTSDDPRDLSVMRDHPRGRGDDSMGVIPEMASTGPPPRARGRRAVGDHRRVACGTTPAGAGTTGRQPGRLGQQGDHPRGRGDDQASVSGQGYGMGPPPRARGRHARRRPGRGRVGTTPAGAGTTTG